MKHKNLKNGKKKKYTHLIILIAMFALLLPLAVYHAMEQSESDLLLIEPEFISAPLNPPPQIPESFVPFSEWNASMPLPHRPLSPTEFVIWNSHYCSQGHVSEMELEILYLTNIERTAQGLPQLTLNYALSRAARFKSQEMLDLNYFASESPIYGHWGNIPMQFIIGHQGLGQNPLAFTNRQIADTTATFIVQSWMNSPSHRDMILHPSVTELGVGVIMRPPVGADIMNITATQLFGHAVVAPEHCTCSHQIRSTSVSAVNSSGTTGGYIDVEIRLDANPGLIGLHLDIDFDRSVLTAISVTPETLMPMPIQPTLPVPDGEALGLTFGAAGFNNIYGAGTLATIRFEINSNATPGTTEVLLSGILAASGEPHFEMFELNTANGIITIGNGYGDSAARVSALNASGNIGGYVDVVINLDENPGLIGLQLDIEFDRSTLTPISVMTTTLMPLPTLPTFPVPINQPLGLTFEAAGFNNIYGTGSLATIRFEINPNVSPGSTGVSVYGIMAMSGDPYYELFEIVTTNSMIQLYALAEKSVHVVASSNTAVRGGYVDVSIDLAANPGLIGLQLDVDFDRNILTAIDVTPGTLMPLPALPVFPVPTNQPLGLIFEAAGFNNVYGTGTLVTIRFRVAPEASADLAVIALTGVLAMSGEPLFEMFEISNVNGYINIFASLRDKLAYLISVAQSLQQNTRVSMTGSDIPQNEFWATQPAHSEFYEAIREALRVLEAYDSQGNP